jgi:hypothetical protein
MNLCGQNFTYALCKLCLSLHWFLQKSQMLNAFHVYILDRVSTKVDKNPDSMSNMSLRPSSKARLSHNSHKGITSTSTPKKERNTKSTGRNEFMPLNKVQQSLH